MPSRFVRPDHSFLARKNETTIVGSTNLDSNILWLLGQETGSIRDGKQELSFHAADDDLAFCSAHDELNRILAPLVAGEFCREVSLHSASSSYAVVSYNN